MFLYLYPSTAGLWAVLTLGYGSKSSKGEEEDRGLLANQSLLLLMVLTNHYTYEKGIHNPYRMALCTFSNSQGKVFYCLVSEFFLFWQPKKFH